MLAVSVLVALGRFFSVYKNALHIFYKEYNYYFVKSLDQQQEKMSFQSNADLREKLFLCEIYIDYILAL